MVRLRRSIPLLLSLCALLVVLMRPQLSYGQRGPEPLLQVAVVGGGVQLSWAAAPGAAAAPNWPIVESGGRQVPAQLIALQVAADAPVVPHVARLVEQPWRGAAPARVDVAVGQRAAPDAGPSAPVTVLRQGRYRGARIVVLAVNALYVRAGSWYAVRAVDAMIVGATPANAGALQSASSAAPTTALPAPNPLAAQAALKLGVAHDGIQRVTGAELAAAGLDLATLAPAQLRLRRAGAEVALEERGTGDGRLDPADELRFYAPAPGDRWNAADTYWLTVEAAPGLRMTARSVTAGGAPLVTNGVEQGLWRQNTLYDSTLAGLDGDHWFAADLRSAPGRASDPIDVPLASPLGAVSGPVQLIVTGSAYTAGTHRLELSLGGAAVAASWSGRGDWSQSFALPQSGATAHLRLLAGSSSDGVEVDAVRWERAAGLAFGGAGAAFRGLPGTLRYQLTQLPPGAALYDIGAAAQPALLAASTPSSLVFEDGPAAHSYLVAGPGTLWSPTVTAHVPVDLHQPRSAELVYIAPAVFHSALQPLVTQRQAEGRSVAVVDVQAIYDTWSGGQVAPGAIRDFLRYAMATWQPAPVAVTLVGDGTSDPLNYTGRNNTNFIPPYLALVDPWIGETACETCYAQLDGDSPLDDPLPDLQIGRLPVKSAAELQSVVSKLVGYARGPVDTAWQSRNVFIADNADGAGDFAAFADAAAALQPTGVDVARMYYDPAASGVSWREPDAAAARQRTIAELSAGAALVNYVGHSNHWQWAVTDPTATPGSLLGLYDVDTLTNGSRLPVVLEMTCYTSAFQQPAYSGTTIDERLLLHPGGGAVAVWGPTGLGVAHGHDALLRGFYAALWSAGRPERGLGALADAGYLELFMHAGCCQDTLRTFALLGDPATQLRAVAARRIWLPVVER